MGIYLYPVEIHVFLFVFFMIKLLIFKKNVLNYKIYITFADNKADCYFGSNGREK